MADDKLGAAALVANSPRNLSLRHGIGKPGGLAQCLTQNHGARLGDIDRTHARAHRDQNGPVDTLVHAVGDARAFASQQQGIVRGERELRIRNGGTSAQKHQAPPFLAVSRIKNLPRGMTPKIDMIDIIHSRTRHLARAEDKTARLDHIDADPQTRAQAQQGPGILRNVRLIQSDAHGIERFREKNP